MKRCSASLIIRGMPIKATEAIISLSSSERYYQSQKITRVGKDVEALGPLRTADSHMERGIVVSQEINYRITI